MVLEWDHFSHTSFWRVTFTCTWFINIFFKVFINLNYFKWQICSNNRCRFLPYKCILRAILLKFWRGGRVERQCWVNFQCWGILLVWMTVGQGPIALAVGAGGGCLEIFVLIYLFSFLSPSLWETARYRLKYCLKGPLIPEQPTNILKFFFFSVSKWFLVNSCDHYTSRSCDRL